MIDYDKCSPQIDYYVHRECSPSWIIAESVIEFIDLTYVVKGSSVYWIDGKEFTVHKGDLLCIPKGCRRSAVTVPDDLMESYPINFTLHTPAGEEVGLPFPLVHNVGYHPDIIALYSELNVEWLRRSPGYLLKSRALVMMILHRYFELIIHKKTYLYMDKRIKQVLQIISDRFSEPLDLKAMSKVVGLNVAYLGNLFKSSVGMTFRQYLTSIRLNHAENLLRRGEHNVNEVAQMCGFSDVFYFSKVFKEIKGMSPSKIYRP